MLQKNFIKHILIFFLYGFTYNIGDYDLLFEPPYTNDSLKDGSKKCLESVTYTMSQVMSPNRFYFKPADIIIISNLLNDTNLHAVMFSKELIDQSYLTPSSINNSAILYFRSLLKKQCPNILQSQRNYNYPYHKKYVQYIIVKIKDDFAK